MDRQESRHPTICKSSKNRDRSLPSRRDLYRTLPKFNTTTNEYCLCYALAIRPLLSLFDFSYFTWEVGQRPLYNMASIYPLCSIFLHTLATIHNPSPRNELVYCITCCILILGQLYSISPCYIAALKLFFRNELFFYFILSYSIHFPVPNKIEIDFQYIKNALREKQVCCYTERKKKKGLLSWCVCGIIFFQ